MMLFLGTALFLIWIIGLYHMWRRQNLSRPHVSVTLTDRLIAIFWIPFCLIFIIGTFFKMRKEK